MSTVERSPSGWLTSSRLVWSVLAFLMAGALLQLFFVEWIELPLGTRFGEEALKNRYLAAHQFLERLSVEVHTVDGLTLLDELPDLDSTLVIASSRRTLSARRQENLKTWLAAGGHLVVVPSAVFDEAAGTSGDSLLDELGILYLKAEERDPEIPMGLEDLTADVLGEDVYCGDAESLAALTFAGSEDTFYTTFPTRGFLYFEGEEDLGYANNSAGTQMLRIAVGRGMLTVLTALSPWDNRRIGCHDHAHTLRLLLADRPALYWLFNTEMPPLTEVIWRGFPALVLVLAAGLASWLWRSAVRVGPLRQARLSERRALMEHVDGVASFLWQSGEEEVLVDAMRNSVRYRLGAGLRDDVAGQVGFLAERSGLEEGVVHWALTAPAPDGRASFKQMMMVLQQLRRSL